LRTRVSCLATASLLLLSGCGLGHEVGLTGPSTDTSLGQTAPTAAVFGYAVADEPQAALAGQQILLNGGNAADAAAAMGFALAVTLPSRASLGGGGACLVRMPDGHGNLQAPVALLFPAGAPAQAGGDRPAAVPLMARGLFALAAGYGLLPPGAVIAPAERLANGAQLSPALEADLTVVGSALLADKPAQAIFAPNGALLPAGATIVQPDLATTLETLRVQGIEGFYASTGGQTFAQAAQAAGAEVSAADLAATSLRVTTPVISSASNITTASLPVAQSLGTLPASAAFMAVDKNGGVVACATSDNNLFGTGRIAPGTGVLLAASPATAPAPQLAAAIAYRSGDLAFRAAVTGTGQNEAATAAQAGLAAALAGKPAPLLATGRANVISCPGGVPGGESTCTASADPRGQGLAAGGH
jgi:gamma-glutamyltranspeptidase/glutathione hydrolase